MKKYIVTVLLTLGLTFSMVASAGAVTNGTPDGTGHPNTVLLLMEVRGAPAFRCSGTLLSSTMLLTAGHCAGAPGEFSGMRVFYESNVEAGQGVTNNYPYGNRATNPNGASVACYPNCKSIEAVSWAAHPLYPTTSFVFHDVGMVELASAVPGVSVFGTLPAVNAFDAFKTKRGIEPVWFTSVGYGLQKSFPNATTWKESRLKIRMVAYPKLLQINVPGFVGDFSMLLSNNASTGGTCFGDSGGPNFLRNTTIVAGITSFGINGNCAGTGGVFRTDRQDVQNFINAFMGV